MKKDLLLLLKHRHMEIAKKLYKYPVREKRLLIKFTDAHCSKQ